MHATICQSSQVAQWKAKVQGYEQVAADKEAHQREVVALQAALAAKEQGATALQAQHDALRQVWPWGKNWGHDNIDCERRRCSDCPSSCAQTHPEVCTIYTCRNIMYPHCHRHG
jgi:hypothetical protein